METEVGDDRGVNEKQTGTLPIETISKPVLALKAGSPSYLFALTLTLSQRERGLLR